jgi:site-specific recombinase XerD
MEILIDVLGKELLLLAAMNEKENTEPDEFIILPDTHYKAIAAYIELLRLMNYSGNTINTYRNWFLMFLRYFNETKPSSITKAEIMNFLLHYRNSKKWSATGQNQLISSIKFFYEIVLKRPKMDYDLPGIFRRIKDKRNSKPENCGY